MQRPFVLKGKAAAGQKLPADVGSDEIRKRFTKNYRVADIIDYWNKDAEAFKARSAKYYLYR